MAAFPTIKIAECCTSLTTHLAIVHGTTDFMSIDMQTKVDAINAPGSSTRWT